MVQPNFSRTPYYVLIIVSFFAVLFVLDKVFGLHYAPEQHRLNHKKVKPADEKETLNAAVAVSLPITAETSPENDVRSEEDVASEESASDVDPAFFKELTDRYQDEVLSRLAPRKSRTDVTIRYYKHPPDGQSAYALQKLGFYIHERPVDPGYENFQSNAIFYGDSVRLVDIQLVAYTLLKEGLPLKTIAPSRFGKNWKSHSIEIGADSTLVSYKTLTLADIEKLRL